MTNTPPPPPPPRQPPSVPPPPPSGGYSDPPPPGSGPTPGPTNRSALIGVLTFVGVVAIAGLLAFMLFGRGGDDGELSGGDTPDELGSETTETDPTPPTTPDDTAPETTAPETTTPETTEPTPTVPTPGELALGVVQIQLLLDGQVTCTGSGTIIEPDGTILTNSHVIAQDPFCPHDTIGVAVLDVPELAPPLNFRADVLVDDPGLDLAVIRISGSLDGRPVTADFPTVEIGDSDTLQLGDRLNVIGYPGIGGDTITFTEGAISGFVSVPGLGDRSWLKTDAALAGGNSGGLAADLDGRIVGIPTIVGTGEGQITDCRFVADTNGDGVIDQNDACVPVGGFINGIRPVNLALPLIDAARSATPMPPTAPMVEQPVGPLPEVSNPVWTLDHDEGFPLSPTVLPPSGTPQLCLTWDFENVPVNSTFDVAWFFDGELEPDASVTGTNTAAFGGFFACITNPDGLADGTYEVAWFIDEVPVFSEAIYLGSDRFEIVLEVINDTDTPLCIVQFSPTLAITFGINRLDTPLLPGRTTVIRLASGVYDRRVFDCDGALLEEDFGGAELFSDSTYTLFPL